MRKLVALVVRYQVGYIHHQQFSSKELDSIQQEDKMCEVCENGGCSNCAPQNDTLQFASGKEIEEFYDLHSESMYVDPAESTPDA
jgi:hypothetical protein